MARIAYYRTSTSEQSIESQRTTLGGPFDEEFKDEGVSGGHPIRRPLGLTMGWVYPEGAPWAPRTRYRPVGRHHTLSHPLTTPFPHSQRPTNAGRSATAKDTIYPNRLSLLSPVGPGAPATGSDKSPTTAMPVASGGTVAVTAVTAVTAP